MGQNRPEATACAALRPATVVWPNRPCGLNAWPSPRQGVSLASPCQATRWARAQGGHCAPATRGGAVATPSPTAHP
jgi:hypothetical protein